MGDDPEVTATLREALAMELEGVTAHAEVHEGWDVGGIPHGGYVAALAARAALLVDGAPDLMTATTHFHRKAAFGPVRLAVEPVGGSRRLRSLRVTATQGDDERPVVTSLVCVGDRSGSGGPSWGDLPVWDPAGARLSAPAGTSDEPFAAPRIAARMGMRLDAATAGFATGTTGEHATVRALAATGDDVDQLAALVVCDATPPAVWNALGMRGWVPTVELTAHVRARPAPGPLSVVATTHHVEGGFLDEDAVVRDATGQVVVLSRQLAMWTGA